ncbi:NAD(P)-dependent oxidoreductase [Leptospira noguchii]|uniref:SDR family oxidoreductase n=1 Tax=Leptospira noguchii TaxID=28182 RepID=A0A9Q8RP55_9LEPT|nr:SDR family oxidoreductase [Leptospira noguchii]TQE83106.1 SDR family oxidoreductase [Leptospira noguchii]UOG29235.1 SDR family oxidoreductase [Leptospira noguchii]UOG35420.1 SDR family oxidoreductase [Leptospira noguchii]UOG46338.1 SDR family oxidoreductase [Leptospira noguchii]UOG54034.1 SDR family oxidoreductase [Leptospira noguchii]
MILKRMLITGSSGFLGGRIAKYFGALNEFELILGTTKNFELPDYIQFGKVILIDWNSQASMEAACENVEYIIHCAGMNAQDAIKNPQKAFEFNGYTTGCLMDAAIKNHCFKFIYFSTAHVYGNPLIGNVSEDSLLTNEHPYAMSNMIGEREVSNRNALDKIFGINIRLSNAFGAPVDPNVNCWMLLVNDLCKQAVTTRRMILKTSGIQRRDFIAIWDVCKAVEHLLRIKSNHKNNTYNVGGNMSLSVWEMANLVRERCKQTLGFLPELERVEPGRNEISMDFNYDVTKLLSTGFHYSNSFLSEIDDLLIFCNSHFKS